MFGDGREVSVAPTERSVVAPVVVPVVSTVGVVPGQYVYFLSDDGSWMSGKLGVAQPVQSPPVSRAASVAPTVVPSRPSPAPVVVPVRSSPAPPVVVSQPVPEPSVLRVVSC